MRLRGRFMISRTPSVPFSSYRYCAYTVTGVYTVYGIVECVAWLADAKLINGDSVKLFRYCLYLWLTALFAGIVRQVRVLVRKGEWSLEKV